MQAGTREIGDRARALTVPKTLANFLQLLQRIFVGLAGAQGKVDTVYRKFELTARAIATRFGEKNLPQKIAKSLTDDPFAEHPIVHCIFPKDGIKSDLFAQIDKPIGSI